MGKVDEDELQKSLQYLEDFEKANGSIEIDEKANGGQEEKINQYKEKINSHIKKAKEYQEAVEKMEKGEDADVVEEEEETEVESSEKVEKSITAEALDEIKKSITNEILDEIKKSKDTEIQTLKDKIEELENTPIRKSIRKSAEVIALEKAAISGEPTNEGKVVLSKRLQKGQISDVLFSAYENEKDEVKKSMYSNAVTEFESTGSYIAPNVVAELYKSKNIQIID